MSSSSRHQLRSSSSNISVTRHSSNQGIFGGGSPLTTRAYSPNRYVESPAMRIADPYSSQYSARTSNPSPAAIYLDRGRNQVPVTQRDVFSANYPGRSENTTSNRPTNSYNYESPRTINTVVETSAAASRQNYADRRPVNFESTHSSSTSSLYSSPIGSGSAIRRSGTDQSTTAFRTATPSASSVTRSPTSSTFSVSLPRDRLLEIPPTSSRFSGIPLGLPNLGNTCYLNSVLQCIFQLDMFTSVLGRAREEARRRTPVTEALERLAKEQRSSERRNLVSFLKSMMGKRNSEFAYYDQADAHELLRTLLFAMHEELNRSTEPVAYMELKDIPNERPQETQRRWLAYHKRRDDSVIYDYFGGVVQSETICKSCGYRSFAFDPFLDLSIPFDKRAMRDEHSQELMLTEMFSLLWEPEDIDKLQAWKCPRCKVISSASRKLNFLEEPKILVFHLKRFNSRGAKVEAPVHYQHKQHIQNKTYRLKGVVCHSGTATTGHYTSYVSVGNSQNDWYCCSDSSISSCTVRDALKATTAAFMLFYES